MCKKIIFFGFFLCFVGFTNGQIKVSQFFQKSQISKTTSNKLYFIDFWATWCGPCLFAEEQLSVLQKQFSEDFYIVSITDESPSIVIPFLDRRPSKLAVARDMDGDLFREHKIKLLPTGLLFNANGKLLWRGSSADLTKQIISKFLKREKKSISVDRFFKIVDDTYENEEVYVPKQPIEIKNITKPINFTVENNKEYLKLKGSLQQIYSYIAKISIGQIEQTVNKNTFYEVYFKRPFKVEELEPLVLEKLQLEIIEEETEGNVIQLKLEKMKLWDTTQFDWGSNSPNFLISELEIQADDVSLQNIGFELATQLQTPVIFDTNSYDLYSLHDWQFHFKYFQLMANDLEDNYGIEAVKTIGKFKTYHIQKKAP